MQDYTLFYNDPADSDDEPQDYDYIDMGDDSGEDY